MQVVSRLALQASGTIADDAGLAVCGGAASARAIVQVGSCFTAETLGCVAYCTVGVDR